MRTGKTGCTEFGTRTLCDKTVKHGRDTGTHPEFFLGRGGGRGVADSEVTYNLFDFKNYIIKIML
jgi:hypothetical protein